MIARRHQRGQAIVLVALMMTVLVGFVALALDSARAFDGRRVLQDAVDAGAVAGAESYQNGATWAAAETNALHLFELDSGLYSGESCSPGIFLPPTPGTPAVTTCTIAGGAGYVLTLTVATMGAAGQTFALSAQRPLSLTLMQVLGQSPSITLTAAGAATAGDQAHTPALAALGQGGCFASPGTALNIGTVSSLVSVRGDIVSNGAFVVGSSSFVHVAGDVLTRCGPPNDASHITYQCWPSGATLPCTGSDVAGIQRSTAFHLADPGFLAPSIAGLVGQGLPGANVVLSPGIYGIDPQFGSGGSCYFLSGGVYEWQAGLTLNSGIVSNQLRPPDEPVTGNNQARAAPQFWDAAGTTCSGSFTLGSSSFADKGIANGTWSVVVTSLRSGRESAPSMCRSFPISGPDKTLVLNINNVPGASGYNVYAQPPTGTPCAGPFGLVRVSSIPNLVTETQASLGSVSASFNSDDLPASWAPNAAAGPDTWKAYPPDGETGPFNGSSTLPNSNPARAASAAALTAGQGDRANENYCATAAGATALCPAAVTPGAVEMYLTNSSCLNVTANGDAFLSSGYQYNWILYYEPPATSCLNTLQGKLNTAAIGMSYTPVAGFRIVGNNASQTAEFGGVMAGSILIQGGTALPLFFNAGYSPRPAGARLTG
jgi:Flp pilus assembly protein TadG